MRYYLETNAIRALAGRLSTVKRTCRSGVTTSFLTVFELLSGITAQEYRQRKGFLKALADSKMAIDWREPLEAFSSAFGIQGYTAELADTTRRMWKLVLCSASYDQANEKCRIHNLRLDLLGIANADRQLSSYHRAERALMAERVRLALDPAGRKVALQAMHADATDAIANELVNEMYYESRKTLIRRGAENLSKHVPGLDSPEGIAALTNAYDGSMDYHFGASTLSQTDIALSGKNTGRNDVFDISHFMYMDRQSIMVSNDKLVVGISMKLWPEQYLSIEKFWEQIETITNKGLQ